MDKIISVAVLGSTGYVGVELVKILLKHPNVKINFLGSSNSKTDYLKKFFQNDDYVNLPLLTPNDNFNPSNSDVVFLALPHGVSNKYVKKYYQKIKIIDMSADFRLDSKEDYIINYNNEHKCFNLLNKFIYGLPEINKELIINSNNISIPGCYPTSILLPLIPLFRENLLITNNIIIDSKSGYSGAGKNFDILNIKNSNDFNFYNYNTNNHRHIIEIKNELIKNTNNKVNFSFNPHILSSFRGMMSTIYCDLESGVLIKDIVDVLKKFTQNLHFVKFCEDDQNFDLFSIQNTNKCLIKLFKHSNESKIIIVSLIDNLIKGAAGQAVQCFNISSNLDEKLSLI